MAIIEHGPYFSAVPKYLRRAGQAHFTAHHSVSNCEKKGREEQYVRWWWRGAVDSR